jgi:hypothetical protein
MVFLLPKFLVGGIMSWIALDCISEEFAEFLAKFINGEIERNSAITAETIINAYIEWEYHGIGQTDFE